MATLSDIAADLNVSVSLVSKVLNGRLEKTRVSPVTAAKVREAAERLGYRRNQSALALLSNRHRVFGVFLHNIGLTGSGIMEAMLAGISSEASAHAYSLRLSFFSSMGQFRAISRDAHTGAMDGLLVGGHFHAELRPLLDALRRAGLPVATVFDVPLDDDIPNAGMLQEEVAILATQHLIDRGCRRIAHIANMKPRLSGYRNCLAAAGLQPDERLIFTAPLASNFGHETGRRAAQAFLEQGAPFDGVVAQSDHEAAGCINVLCDAGVAVPGDVRVIGMDDASFCELVRVPLSSVSMEYRRRGSLAVDMLLALTDGKRPHSCVVNPVLKARASTG